MTEEAFDYIVIGGGSVGSVLASRISEDQDVSVLVLEAGGSDAHWTIRMPGGVRSHLKPASDRNWHFETVEQPHLNNRRLYQPRGKVIGGTSSINGMVFLRGHPNDFECWAREGCKGWSYADVLPYFKRLETAEFGSDFYRGESGPVAVRRQKHLDLLSRAFLQAGHEAGFPFTDDVNGAQQEGFCRLDMNVDRGVRASSGYAYLHRSRQRNNLIIRTHCLVERIAFEGNKATTVHYRQGSKQKIVRSKREIILSAGVFGSPQILQLSGLGPAEHLRSHGIDVVMDLPAIGENLQDHLEVQLQHKCTQDVTLNRHLRLDRMLKIGVEWFLFKSGVAARNQSNTGAFLRSNASVMHPNIQFHFSPFCFSGNWDIRHDVNGYRIGSYALRPTSRGTVRLAGDDPALMPLIDPNYLSTPNDQQEIIEGFQLARDVMAQPAFKAFDAGETDPMPAGKSRKEIEAFIRQHASSAYHATGTCKMGAEDDETAVVDPEARVRGVSGIRVVDTSIIPNVPSSNPLAVALMIGEKVADVIRGKAPLEPLRVPFKAAELAG